LQPPSLITGSNPHAAPAVHAVNTGSGANAASTAVNPAFYGYTAGTGGCYGYSVVACSAAVHATPFGFTTGAGHTNYSVITGFSCHQLLHRYWHHTTAGACTTLSPTTENSTPKRMGSMSAWKKAPSSKDALPLLVLNFK
jgi:hypothetical protein